MGVLEDKIKYLPTNPGVYVMQDKDGKIIYVGKAKNLKNRVRQYFFNSVKTEKVMAMVSNIADFYYIIVPSEIDALTLENTLIKKHKPKYNILLKDDKTYPYLKIDLKEPYPKFVITRKIKKDGCKYFGPFMGGINCKEILEIINLAFNVRPCDKKLNPEKAIKPCLNYHIKKCTAPCALYISQEDYKKSVLGAVEFMNGETAQTEKLLREKMLLASEREEFELALRYKTNIESLEKIKLKRVTSLNKFIDADILAYSNNGIYYAVSVMFVRKGRTVGSKNFSFESVAITEGEVLHEFVMQYYKENSDIPEEIITGEDIAESDLLEEYFNKNFGKEVNFICAKQGVRKQLVDMATANSIEHLSTAVDRIKHKNDMTHEACKKLKDVLSLRNFPKRMECYDISNISGVDKVGSMVVFINGEADRSSYRRFKIKTFEGADDYRAHQEMMRRRLDRLITDAEKFPKPDLMVIDGGKGQLSAIREVFNEKGIEDIDLIALAERNEEIYVEGKSEPIVLPKSDYTLRMLQRIRDEAHRFAITYHRTLRGKRALSSVLDKIKGLGKVRKSALLLRFKDLSGIITASEEELLKVEGIGKKQAKEIIETLSKEGLR